VEGANILTRTLMVFGQGAIRCHPYVYHEIRALASGDVRTFDDAFTSHVGHVVRNKCRAIVLSLTRGWAANVPGHTPVNRYYRRMAWASASFAFLADLAMATLGGNLKRKEKITGRFADILAWMYVGASVLRRYEAEGRRKEDLPLVHWSMQYALAQMQDAFDGLFQNIHVPGLSWLFRGPIAFWSRLNTLGVLPSDRLGGKLARLIQTPGQQRDRLTDGIYLPVGRDQALGRLEYAFALSREADEVSHKIKTAVRARRLQKDRPDRLLEQALAGGIVSEAEAHILREAEAAREDYIQVDSFPNDLYLRHFSPSIYDSAGDGEPLVEHG
jgi:acyl-CoA dehydrogenase